MKRVRPGIWFALGVSLAALVAFRPEAAVASDPSVYLAIDVDGDGVHDCSATVVSSRAVLTSTHCFFKVEGLVLRMHGEVPVRIDDGRDNTLLVFHTHRFSKWARVRKSPPRLSERVTILGNPGHLRSVLREGYVAATLDNGVVLYDLNAFPGDSGASLRDTRGRVVAVQSFVDVQHTRGVYLKLPGSFGFGFSEKEWRSAGVRRKK